MSRPARWVRLRDAQAWGLSGIAGALARRRAHASGPIVLWSSGGYHGHRRSGAAQPGFAVLAAAHVAPGRTSRWPAWALSPALAAYREFGVRAYLDGAELRLRGSRIALAHAAKVLDGVIAVVSLDAELHRAGEAGAAANERGEFRAWLRDGIGDALAQWSDRVLCMHRFEAALRARFEAQHGWQFESSWFCPAERNAIATTSPPALTLPA